MFGDNQNKMDREKVKLIVRNMELLLDALKQEVQDIPESQSDYVSAFPYIDDDVDEYYSEEENDV
jgi:hypothetical protein